MTDRFTAWAMCPQCRSVDCHWIREPIPKPKDECEDEYRIEQWGGITVKHYKLGAWDETVYEVIRTCTACGWEWGMK